MGTLAKATLNGNWEEPETKADQEGTKDVRCRSGGAERQGREPCKKKNKSQRGLGTRKKDVVSDQRMGTMESPA